MPREKRPENMVGLRLEIPVEYRDRLMVLAAQQGQSMAACLRQLTCEWIDARRLPATSKAAPKSRKKKETPE